MDLIKFHPDNLHNIDINDLNSLTKEDFKELALEYPDRKYPTAYLMANVGSNAYRGATRTSYQLINTWHSIGFSDIKILGLANMNDVKTEKIIEQEVIQMGDLELLPINKVEEVVTTQVIVDEPKEVIKQNRKSKNKNK